MKSWNVFFKFQARTFISDFKQNAFFRFLQRRFNLSTCVNSYVYSCALLDTEHTAWPPYYCLWSFNICIYVLSLIKLGCRMHQVFWVVVKVFVGHWEQTSWQFFIFFIRRLTANGVSIFLGTGCACVTVSCFIFITFLK